jgi:hypothetical protein
LVAPLSERCVARRTFLQFNAIEAPPSELCVARRTFLQFNAIEAPLSELCVARLTFLQFNALEAPLGERCHHGTSPEPRMAKGQYLSSYQQGIVKRYYAHIDTLSAQRLGELVSELYLCTDPKKSAKMWERAAADLDKAGIDPARTRKVIEAKNVEALAKLVSEVSPGGKAAR